MRPYRAHLIFLWTAINVTSYCYYTVNSWLTLVLCAETVAQCYWRHVTVQFSSAVSTYKVINRWTTLLQLVLSVFASVGTCIYTWLAVQSWYLYLYFRVYVLDTSLSNTAFSIHEGWRTTKHVLHDKLNRILPVIFHTALFTKNAPKHRVTINTIGQVQPILTYSHIHMPIPMAQHHHHQLNF